MTLRITAAALTALLCVPTLTAQIVLPATVDDTTFGPLRSGNTYLANTSVTVPAGKTLTVEPGAVVKLAARIFSIGNALFVDGTLDAVGTAQQPIFFTSSNDDSVGLAIGTGAPMPGDWQAVVFRAGSDQSVL